MTACCRQGRHGHQRCRLRDFEHGGTAGSSATIRQLVHRLAPGGDEPWKIVERAEFLLKLEPILKYNLIGRLELEPKPAD